MLESRRKRGDTHYEDGRRVKPFYIIGEPLKADKLPMPTFNQIRDAVKPIDYRWKPSWTRRFFLHPVTMILLSMIVIVCFGYVGYELIF